MSWQFSMHFTDRQTDLFQTENELTDKGIDKMNLITSNVWPVLTVFTIIIFGLLSPASATDALDGWRQDMIYAKSDDAKTRTEDHTTIRMKFMCWESPCVAGSKMRVDIEQMNVGGVSYSWDVYQSLKSLSDFANDNKKIISLSSVFKNVRLLSKKLIRIGGQKYYFVRIGSDRYKFLMLETFRDIRTYSITLVQLNDKPEDIGSLYAMARELIH